MSYPYLAKTTLKYKSPHATDLSFAKNETIRVTGPNPEDEDWLIGETLDGARSGGFPKDFVVEIEKGASEEEGKHSEQSSAEPLPTNAAAVGSSSDTAEMGASSAEPVSPSNPAPPSPTIEAVPLPPASPAPNLASAPTPGPASILKESAPPSPAKSMTTDEAKPQSMKDRLAFFAAAQNKVAPPPPVKPKPAAAGGLTWSQRQKLRQEQEEKEKAAGGGVAASPVAAPPVPAAQMPTSSSDTADTEKKVEATGMSASDASSSISKGQSLKERMAALQGAGAFGSPSEKATPPAPSAKPKVWSRPPAPPQAEEDEEDPAERKIDDSAMAEKGENSDLKDQERAGDDGVEEEETEEEKEKARRAAIAARMAKLGGRGPMGMTPPAKPTRKPSRDASTSPTVEKAEPSIVPDQIPEVTESAKSPVEVTEPLSTAPVSIKVPAMPRRTAPPRRKGTAPSTGSSTSVGDASTADPPAQVMVADEEKPLPKSAEQVAQEKEQEGLGRGEGGYGGAIAAGIAMMSIDADSGADRSPPSSTQKETDNVATLAPSDRGLGVVGEGAGSIINQREEPQEIASGIRVGGEEKDEIMREAEEGEMEFETPVEPTGEAEMLASSRSLQPIATVPLHSPAPSGHMDVEGETPPPPPPRMSLAAIGKDEIEMKHEQDATDGEDDAPPPPPARTERPAGPRPLPSAPRSVSQNTITEAQALPPPPVGNSMIPPRDEEEEDDEEDKEINNVGTEEEQEPGDEAELQAEKDEEVGNPIEADQDEEEDDDVPPPPPRRQATLPSPVVIAAPSSAQKATEASPVSPQAARSPTASVEQESASSEDAAEASRRSGIAARMAKLGGIKFGMPPPVFRKQTMPDSAGSEETVGSPMRETPSATSEQPILASAPATEAEGSSAQEETQEDESTRKRATLARLRAGGALGFGMFNHGPASPSAAEDPRQLDAESAVAAAPPFVEEDDTELAPPIPRTPAGPPTTQPPTSDDEEDEAPPPPPPGRPPVPVSRPSVPIIATSIPNTPTKQVQSPMDQSASPSTPIRTPSFGTRPPVPSAEKRMSVGPSGTRQIPQNSIPEGRVASQSPAGGSWQLADEPAVMAMDQDFSSPPPQPIRQLPPIQTTSAAPVTGPQTPASPRRSLSSVSRTSMDQSQMSAGVAGMSPASRQASRQSTDPRPSFSTGRPGFSELQEAANNHGQKLARAARGMFEQGKKGYYGDGSPVGFVLVAMDNAHLPRPQQSWGQVVYEQESSSVLKRFDEPRPGDIAAFHDAKLKGKKGLSSYSQAVGSVEEPLVGIVAEFDNKNKHKMRVLQVERGVPEEVSYRLDDLKSGKVLIYRPGV